MKTQKYLYYFTLFAISFIFLNGRCKKRNPPPPPPPPAIDQVIHDKQVVIRDPQIVNGTLYRSGLPLGCTWDVNIPATYTFDILIYDYTISPPGPTLWSTTTARNTDLITVGGSPGYNLDIPSNSYFSIEVTIVYDDCTDCCSKQRLGPNSNIDGCEATIPGNPEMGRPRVRLYTEYERYALNPGPYDFWFDEATCICDCD